MNGKSHSEVLMEHQINAQIKRQIEYKFGNQYYIITFDEIKSAMQVAVDEDKGPTKNEKLVEFQKEVIARLGENKCDDALTSFAQFIEEAQKKRYYFDLFNSDTESIKKIKQIESMDSFIKNTQKTAQVRYPILNFLFPFLFSKKNNTQQSPISNVKLVTKYQIEDADSFFNIANKLQEQGNKSDIKELFESKKEEFNKLIDGKSVQSIDSLMHYLDAEQRAEVFNSIKDKISDLLVRTPMDIVVVLELLTKEQADVFLTNIYEKLPKEIKNSDEFQTKVISNLQSFDKTEGNSQYLIDIFLRLEKAKSDNSNSNDMGTTIRI